MIKRFKKLFTIIIALIMMTSTVLADSNFAKAEDIVPNNSSEKKLLQCSDGWTVFRYTASDGTPHFEVYYEGKSAEEYQEDYENDLSDTIIQFRTGFEKDFLQDWKENEYLENRINHLLDDYDEGEEEFYTVDFRLVKLDFDENYDPIYTEINRSEVFNIFDTSRPHIISNYKYDYFESYDVIDGPNNFNVRLKLDQPLKQVGEPSVDISTDMLFDNHLDDYYATNLSFENFSEDYTFKGVTYTLVYSIITFDVHLSEVYYTSHNKETQVNVHYYFDFNGLHGLYDNMSPEKFSPWAKTKALTVPIESVTINAPNSTVKAGESVQLTADILPANATNKYLTWSCSNNNYATVDYMGKVTTKSAGAGKTVTITATTHDGSNITTFYTLRIESNTTNKPEKPSLVATFNGAQGIGVQWKKTTGATSYNVYRKYQGKWSKIKTVSANDKSLQISGDKIMYTDTAVKTKYGQGYIYSVSASNAAGEGKYNTTGLAAYRLVNPEISKVVANGSGKATVTWTKVSCQGYEVQYATESNAKANKWTKAKEVKYGKVTQTISGLKKGQKYVFRIRCEKTNKDRGTTWSQYSGWKTVKVK